MKLKPVLNPNVFVKDENDPAFRAHIAHRAKQATDPNNRSKNLSLAEARLHLAKYRKNPIVHA